MTLKEEQVQAIIGISSNLLVAAAQLNRFVVSLADPTWQAGSKQDQYQEVVDEYHELQTQLNMLVLHLKCAKENLIGEVSEQV